MSDTKPHYRVKAGRVPVRPESVTTTPRRSASGYMRDTRSSVLSTRMSPVTDSRDAIRRAWRRVAGVAQDLIMNSGQLSGAMQQIISDTIGSELMLDPKPDAATLKRMGYDDTEIADLLAIIKREWKYWSWNPDECDQRGKLTVAQMMDVGLRQYMAYGEALGAVNFWSRGQRRRNGVQSGTKVMMIAPSRLVQDTSEIEGLFQGVYHDADGRPVQYLIEERNAGFSRKVPYPVRDGHGLRRIIHQFEPNEADDVRGISPMAPAFRRHIQGEMVEDATLQMMVLQTSLAIALTSAAPSEDAFEALAALKDEGSGKLASAFLAMFAGQIDKAADGTLSFGTDPQISHLAPGEKLDIQNVTTPGPEYAPFRASLSRQEARALGITYESFSLDNRGATYSSSRMGIASIWPVVTRRRERISAPQGQIIYENFFDEAVFRGLIPIKGGFEAYRANRDRLVWAQWRGPAKPTADDYKSAKASSERILNMTSSMDAEAAELGHDPDELREQQKRDHTWYVENGMRSPYERAATASPEDKSLLADESRGQDA